MVKHCIHSQIAYHLNHIWCCKCGIKGTKPRQPGHGPFLFDFQSGEIRHIFYMPVDLDGECPGLDKG